MHPSPIITYLLLYAVSFIVLLIDNNIRKLADNDPKVYLISIAVVSLFLLGTFYFLGMISMSIAETKDKLLFDWELYRIKRKLRKAEKNKK